MSYTQPKATSKIYAQLNILVALVIFYVLIPTKSGSVAKRTFRNKILHKIHHKILYKKHSALISRGSFDISYLFACSFSRHFH
jgi:hypothetical protein